MTVWSSPDAVGLRRVGLRPFRNRDSAEKDASQCRPAPAWDVLRLETMSVLPVVCKDFGTLRSMPLGGLCPPFDDAGCGSGPAACLQYPSDQRSWQPFSRVALLLGTRHSSSRPPGRAGLQAGCPDGFAQQVEICSVCWARDLTRRAACDPVAGECRCHCADSEASRPGVLS